MAHSHTAHFRVRYSELFADEEMPNRALAHLLQEAAMDASAAAGYGLRWYEQYQSAWVLREMTLEHLRPIRYQDEVDITTWLSEIQRVRARREYVARNTHTGEVVARASGYWAHINRVTLLPTRIPANMIAEFAPSVLRSVLHLRPRTYPPPAAPREMRTGRHVRHHEADPMQHVNNAVYLDWFEEPLREITPPGQHLCVRRHDVEYVRGALPGDDVELVTRLAGVGRCATTWSQEITRGSEVIARDHLTALWLDAQGRPVRQHT